MQEPVEMGNWFLGLVVFMSLLANVMLLWRMLMRRPERREVSILKDAATRGEFEKHVTANDMDHRSIFSKMHNVEQGMRAEMRQELRRIEQLLESLRKENKDDTRGVHERINNVLAAVERLSGQISAKT